MKIPPANPLPLRPSPEPNRAAATTRRGQPSTDATRADDPFETADGGGEASRDFASVFDEVAARPEPREDESAEGDRRLSRDAERTDHDGSARRHEEREGGGSDNAGGEGRGGGFEHRAALRETSVAGDATNARSILHVADLERIVSAVRSQIADGGRHVVTIELRRSVLEGLKVRLSADAGGRVTAEFIAASERVRSQLDARATELADLLRGRGVQLAALRTGVEAGGGGDAPGGFGGDAREELSRTAAVAPRAASQDATEAPRDDAPAEDSEGGASSTYRA
jgi:hypothetical protein